MNPLETLEKLVTGDEEVTSLIVLMASIFSPESPIGIPVSSVSVLVNIGINVSVTSADGCSVVDEVVLVDVDVDVVTTWLVTGSSGLSIAVVSGFSIVVVSGLCIVVVSGLSIVVVSGDSDVSEVVTSGAAVVKVKSA